MVSIRNPVTRQSKGGGHAAEYAPMTATRSPRQHFDGHTTPLRLQPRMVQAVRRRREDSRPRGVEDGTAGRHRAHDHRRRKSRSDRNQTAQTRTASGSASRAGKTARSTTAPRPARYRPESKTTDAIHSEARADREAFEKHLTRLTQEQSRLTGIVEQIHTAQPPRTSSPPSRDRRTHPDSDQPSSARTLTSPDRQRATPARCSTSKAPSPSTPRATPSIDAPPESTRTARPRSASRSLHRATKGSRPWSPILLAGIEDSRWPPGRPASFAPASGRTAVRNRSTADRFGRNPPERDRG